MITLLDIILEILMVAKKIPRKTLCDFRFTSYFRNSLLIMAKVRMETKMRDDTLDEADHDDPHRLRLEWEI